MLVYFDRNEIETLKMLILYLYDSADHDEDAHLWKDTHWFHEKIKTSMATYGEVVNDDMTDDI
jgi:hypothetical protein